MSLPNDFEGRCKMLDYMIEGLMSVADNLSEWEYNFLLSVGEQYEKNKLRKYTLSDKQSEIIENLYNKHF